MCDDALCTERVTRRDADWPPRHVPSDGQVRPSLRGRPSRRRLSRYVFQLVTGRLGCWIGNQVGYLELIYWLGRD